MACRLFDSKLLSKSIPHDPRTAAKLIIVTGSAIFVWGSAAVLQTHLQQSQDNVCNIYVIDYAYMTRWICIYAYLIMYTCIFNNVYMYT